MRADRLLSMLLLLDRHRRLTAAELAARLEVSARTVYRDLDALSAAGVPVFAERGRGGACCLPGGYRVRLNGLSAGEAQALSLPLPRQVLADLGLSDQAELALRKLLVALPEELRPQAQAARERILVDPGGWDAPDETVAQLELLRDAVAGSLRVRLHYERGDGSSVERVVDPLGLVAKGRVWYLVAAVDGQVRTYRVARIGWASLTGEAGQRPRDFDLATFWRESSAAFRAAIPRYSVVVRAGAGAAGDIRAVRRVRLEAEDGSRLTLSFDSEAEAVAFALTQDVEVEEPPELRAKLAQWTAELAKRYRAERSVRARHSARSSRMS